MSKKEENQVLGQITVRQLIEMLQKFDPDAIICNEDMQPTMFSTMQIRFFSVESVTERKQAEYVNNLGKIEKGNLVTFF